MLGRSNADTRRRRLLVWLGIALFALRSLVPVGFMLSAGASGAAVTLCPDYAPVPPAAAALHAHHHHHAARDAAADGSSAPVQLPGAEGHGLCPFAAAGLPAWHGPKPVVVPPALEARRPSGRAPSDAAAVRLLLVTSRSPRGPPLLPLA
jgi:hypothetical protein